MIVDEVLQREAIEEFHGDEGAALGFADVIDGADVGMIKGGGGFGLALEACEGLGISGDVIGEEFEGDVAVEADVFGLVDHAHTSATELFGDAVMRDGLADEGVGGGHGADILGGGVRGSQRGEKCARKEWQRAAFSFLVAQA